MSTVRLTRLKAPKPMTELAASARARSKLTGKLVVIETKKRLASGVCAHLDHCCRSYVKAS